VGNEKAMVVFSSDLSAEQECATKLPTDTVLLVEIELETPATLDSLAINKRNFKTFDPSTPRNIGYKGYIDKREGLVIKTYKGEVLQLDYIAARKDVRLCPSYYEDPESFIQLMMCGLGPTPNISCPTKDPVDGEQVEFSASMDVAQPSYTWTVSAGRIVGGQGTNRIAVDTTGVGGKTILATVDVNDGSNHTSTISCETKVLLKPNP
jgi:hypothetical protein